ncbi:MAG: winged helix-turn-helix domain-containing protein [Kiritimatiellae bacterium]|nr:winged helix-turn-helix domain-containing protein [Kiritimatiellia bacterium]
MERTLESDTPAAADLTRTEALLFDALRSRPGVVWSRCELLEAMHGKTRGNVQEHAVDAMVARLRKELGAAGGCIETVRGRGLRWNPTHLSVDRKTRTAFVGGFPVDLALSERAVLAALASRPGRIFSPEKLAASLSLSEPTIRSVVASLRHKLGPAGACVETVHGRGYRFRPKRRASRPRIAAAAGGALLALAVAGLALVLADGRGTARTEASLVPEAAGTTLPPTEAEAVEIAKRETADLFYDRNAAPAVEFGSSVCKVTFWFPPDPGLPGKTFAAATVWIDVEKKSVIQVEVVED